jgi:ribosome-associated protein
MIRVTRDIAIEEHEIEEEFVRSPGPGGQNVNKVATAVQLRFDVMRSPLLSQEVKERLGRLAGRRMTQAGVLVIEARRYRTQERNRTDARERLAKLIEAAVRKPKKRVPTRPTAAARQRRLESKRRRGRKKRLRSGGVSDE